MSCSMPRSSARISLATGSSPPKTLPKRRDRRRPWRRCPAGGTGGWPAGRGRRARPGRAAGSRGLPARRDRRAALPIGPCISIKSVTCSLLLGRHGGQSHAAPKVGDLVTSTRNREDRVLPRSPGRPSCRPLLRPSRDRRRRRASGRPWLPHSTPGVTARHRGHDLVRDGVAPPRHLDRVDRSRRPAFR